MFLTYLQDDPQVSVAEREVEANLLLFLIWHILLYVTVLLLSYAGETPVKKTKKKIKKR
ncbi:hypothetical protein HSX11_26345 [Oxalobacteraceae bacterium]|nr:hypothetical protein [Oxalobacteraceae bacterium]